MGQLAKPIMEIKMTLDKMQYQARNLRSLWGTAKVKTGVQLAKALGVLTIHGNLSAVLCQRVGDSALNGGRMIDLGTLGARVVTDDGVAFLVDDWDDDSKDITNMNFHDSGTSAAAEAASDSNLIAEAGPTTRATGTKSQPSANIIRSVGTIAYTGTLAIVEHGLFSTAARTTDELWDRTVFAAINVVNGDSIQFTYDCTLTAGS